MSAATAQRSTGRGTQVLLWLCVLLGLALRIWFSSWGLNLSRFWDERYSLINVRVVYATGDLKPANAYYPSPVFSLPQAAVLRASDALYARTGKEVYRVLDRQHSFTATGFFLCRLVQTVYGTAAIIFVFLAGRVMFSPRIGLLAAMLVAFSPWPIHASAYIKPDSLLLMAIAMSLWASLAAVERPTIGRHVLAGFAIALAMSSKLTGGMIAFCLVLATLVLGWRDRRRWLYLAVAGASSALSFILMNPYWSYYFHFLEGLKRDYLMRADLHGSTRLAMPAEVLGFITGEYLHGIVLGVLSVVGLGWLAVKALRRGGASEAELLERAKQGMFVVFPLVYTVVYIAQTPYFKANNFLPLVPFTSIAAAWVLVRGFSRAARRWRPLRRPAAVAAAFLALAAWQAARGFVYAYRSYTPTTRDAAIWLFDQRLKPLNGRLILLERWDEPDPKWGSARRFGRELAGLKQAERLDALPSRELELSDGLLFFERRLSGANADFYQGLIAGLPEDRVHHFGSEPFERRGDAFIAVLLSPERVEPIFDLATRPCAADVASGEGCLELDLPELDLPADPDPGEAFNLYLFLPHESLGPDGVVPSIELGGRSIELIEASNQTSGKLFLTPRFRLDGSVSRVRLRRGAAFGEGGMKIQLIRWSLDRPTTGSAGAGTRPPGDSARP